MIRFHRNSSLEEFSIKQGYNVVSIVPIEKRLAVDGFPELDRHWRKFISQHPDGNPPSFDQLMVRTRRHTQILFGRPGVIVLLTTIFAGPIAWIYARCIATAMVQRGILFSESVGVLLFIATWATLNLVLLLLYCIMLIQRYYRSPLEPLLADWTGWMLTQESIRFFLRSTNLSECSSSLTTNPRIALDWEESEWSSFLVKQQQQWMTVPKKQPEQMIRDWLIAFLGTKDEVRRKFVSGVYYSSLREGKASVTRFCRQHAAELSRNRNQLLSVSDGIVLLEALLVEELIAEGEAPRSLQRFLTAARENRFLPDHGVEARIWRRDPFVDLTHQTEFYSSASLRGIQTMGRGSKGRLGTFGFLINPSIFAIDFLNSTGRCVRARVALAILDSPNQHLDTFLYVDGVEGSNAIEPQTVHRALLQFANDHQLNAVFYNQNPYNRTPQRMIRNIRDPKVQTEINMRYLDLTELQYLDAFGWPIEPMEYAFPKGKVIGYWYTTQHTYSDRKPADPNPPGRKPKRTSLLIQTLKMYSLWILMSECLLFAVFGTAAVSPWFIPILGLIAAVGIVSHIRYQRKAILPYLQNSPRPGCLNSVWPERKW
jgi:hypothetical protein